MKFLFSRTRVVFFHVISLSLSFGIITAWAGNPNNTAQQNLTLKKVTTNQIPKAPP